jgi:lysophospholipase L1-like esterase
MIKMRRSLAVPVLTAALLVGVGLANVDAAQAESNGGVRVMALGDSITDGVNVPGGYRITLWQKFVSGGYRVDFVGSQSNGPASLGDHDHEGHSGWTIDQISNNVVGWLQATKPQVVLLHIGTNDMNQSGASGAPSRLSSLIDKITTTVPDAEVFVATIIPLSWNDSAVRTFNAAIPGIVQAKVAAGRHVHLVEMYGALTVSDLADGVHPNAGGYAKMATVWYQALQSVPGSLTNGVPQPSPTPSDPGPTPTNGPGDSNGCTATYSVVNQWQGGFQADVTVTAWTAAISGWTVTWAYGDGQTVSTSWNATVTSSGSTVTARNSSYNGDLGAGKSTAFGLTGTWNGTNSVPSVRCTAS